MMQKFIVQKIDPLPAKAEIKGQDARHISKVLRLKSGDTIEITDGRGRDCSAVITAVFPDTIVVDIIEEHASLTESPLHITLCSGMLKDKKMDFVIKHVTQLGIQEWIPFFCERSIPTPSEKRVENRLSRWKTIAGESLKQCRRSRLPKISKPLGFENLIDHAFAYDLKIAFWEKARNKLGALETNPSPKKVLILIGPEGGFSQSEIRLANEKGVLSYSLGPRILRAETASISSCTLIQHLLGDI